ncbi:MAG: hypothetical protein ACXVXI_04970 [Mycobacteriaceae bacterium]
MGDDNGAEPPRPVSVAELLARNGQAVAPSGGRRRRAEPEQEAPVRVPEPPPERDASVQDVPTQGFPAPRKRPMTSAVVVRRTLAQLLPLLGSAVAGAVLWFGFRWLWAEWPVVALVLALAFTVGVVVFVRVTRRVEDLWSALLAVVVGLIVTVSPAMLTLVGR